MKLLICMFIFIGNVLADNKSVAIRSVQKALLKYNKVNKAKKDVEKYLSRRINKRVLIYLPIVAPLLEGKVSTKHVKNLKIKINEVTIQPNIDYNLKNKDLNTNIAVKIVY